jgi:hypothetical protein
MKSWRNGFMRCRTRDDPCGSHHVAARALKWEISSGLTDDPVAFDLRFELVLVGEEVDD